MSALRALLGLVVAVIVGLTFVWPAAFPGSRGDEPYRWLAVGALWTFLALLAALLWVKACRAPRT